MNGYELSRAWFDWSFVNPEKVKPIHTAIYFFAIEHSNRLGWKEKFGFPSQMVMDAIGVKKFQTYGKALRELSEWGFIEFIEKSKNQYSANIIQFATSKNGKAQDKALDKAFIKHGAKHGHSTGHSTGQGMDSIDKPINKELSNYGEKDFLEDWAICRKKIKNLPTNLSGLKPNELNDFNDAKKNFDRSDFQEAMQGLFRQEKINFTSMILRPGHFLERVELYLNAFRSKDFKLYGAKPVEH